MNISDNCKLCNAIKDSLNNREHSLIENRLLFSTESFVVTPTIGPLKPGHVIISSKEHYLSLSSMKVVEIEELQEILVSINNNINYKDYIIVEHGPLNENHKGGACIMHTHLHVIPTAKKIIRYFDNLPNFKIMNDFNNAINISYPYLLIATKNIIKIFNAENFPSQYIRRIYFSLEKINSDWDWKVQKNNNYNDQTILMWKNGK